MPPPPPRSAPQTFTPHQILSGEESVRWLTDRNIKILVLGLNPSP